MPYLEERILRLIGIGAAVAANCQHCLQINAVKALECGASEPEILEAIQAGKMVRRGAASMLDQFIASHRNCSSPANNQPDGCGCQ
jgi:alkylhydroperoxidase/carboxymuconolactone decarboxylase family protein YurZ